MIKEFEIVMPAGREPDGGRLAEEARRALGLPRNAQPLCRIVKRSLDARREPMYRYRIEACPPGEALPEYQLPPLQDVHGARPVIVVGAGPAGMFAAIKLCTLGLRPIVLERGKDVHERKTDMAALSRSGIVDPDSNYCFGEGGAGAFSDGKLYTRSSKRGDNREVLCRLVECGASPDILLDAHPHIGSDKLPAVVENIRKAITAAGGEYHFGARVNGISRDGDGRYTLTTSDGRSFAAGQVILATGHSARDVYELLRSAGATLEAKGFALGVRVEHPQRIINDIRYHGRSWAGMQAAEYSFVEQVDGRGVFSFCMCPGGILVPSSTEPGALVLNGMSNSARNSRWANAGVVVGVEPQDVPGTDEFRLLDWQREVERRMFAWVNQAGAPNPMAAPAQRMKDFCRGLPSKDLPASSYFPGTVSAPLHELLPENIYLRLRQVFPKIDRSMHGYYTNEALLLGVESRTSSPLRIVRDPETLQAPGLPGLYPCGEGAGYAGGIVSSAIDGIRCAEKAAGNYA